MNISIKKRVKEEDIRRNAGRVTYSGVRPNMRVETATAMTPRKNEIFSRVWTTFVDCHVAESLDMRLETYAPG